MVASAIVDSDISVGLSSVAYIGVGSRRGYAGPAALWQLQKCLAV